MEERNINFTPEKGEYLCTAERVTETHPMAEILGTVSDFEDYKQKIVKQRKLKTKTVNAVKNYLSNDEIKFIETKIDEEINNKNDEIFKPVLKDIKTPFKSLLKINFKNNAEKYEYLIKNDPNNPWIEEFKKTKEYELLYA